jgi:LacI family transcriptional regulator, galactose operon repressor
VSPTPPRPTSHDIAREAGVSQSTVSRALRNHPRVKPLTARRVREAAARLGYVPDDTARALITGRTNTIAIEIADITNPFFPEIVDVLHDELTLAGYRVVLFNERTDRRPDAGLQSVLRGRAVDGVIITAATLGDRTNELLRDGPLPAVMLNRDVRGFVGLDRVVADNRGGSRRAAAFLHERGHRGIAFVAGPGDASTSLERERGFCGELQRLGSPVTEALRRAGPFSHAHGYRAGGELLALREPPTAIFCANDVIAFGVLDAARAAGVRVPEELSVVGFDDIPMAAWEAFSLTTVRQPLGEMARAAVSALVGRLRGGSDWRPRRQVFATELIERGTAGYRGRR